MSSCPCVETVQGSLLIPVHVERQVHLRGRNLRLFQVCLPSQLTACLPFRLLGHLTVFPSLRKQEEVIASPRFLSRLGLNCTVAYRAQLLKPPDRHVLCPQDDPRSSECVLELEGREVAVEAQVECDPPPDTWCHVTCQQHQV